MLRGTYLLIKALLLGTVVQNCGTDTDTATFLNASFAPDAPKPGDAVTLSFAYDLHKPITGGIAAYSVTLNGIPFNTKDDLCTQTSCPKDPGTYIEWSHSTFPQISGKVSSKIQWFDQDNSEVLCVTYSFRT
jgi:hypothetical protein